MKNTIRLTALAGVLAPLCNAATTITVNPSDLTYVSAQTTVSALNSVARGNSDQIEVRSRPQGQINDAPPNEAARDNRSVATFANFDISSIPAGSTIISATLAGTYDTRLNTANSSGPAAVGAVTVAWDNDFSAGNNNPIFSYGTDVITGDTIALNTQTLIADILGTTPSGQATATADFTNEVQGWLDGTLDNNGLVFFIEGFGAQGAGFNNVDLEIEYAPIPEPSAAALGGLALLGLLRRRRNN